MAAGAAQAASTGLGRARLVAYERVSTARQGARGLEAQRKTIDDFATSRRAEVLARFAEVESGKRADRPELARALHLAQVTGATLVIAKLDRLSRNAAFLLALRDSGVRLIAVDRPQAKDLTVGIMALVAPAGRELISRRTREALAVSKVRGVSWVTPMARKSSGRLGRAVWRCVRRCRSMRMGLLRIWHRSWRTSGRQGMCRCVR